MPSPVLPLPKPAGTRPPSGGPPVTTFSSSPDEGGDPIHRRIAASVDDLLRACARATPEDYPVMVRLMDQRQKMIERELTMLRMIGGSPSLPPRLFSNYWFGESFSWVLSEGETGSVGESVKRRFAELMRRHGFGGGGDPLESAFDSEDEDIERLYLKLLSTLDREKARLSRLMVERNG